MNRPGWILASSDMEVDVMLLYTPAVFAVGRNYQIMVPVEHETLLWVRVGNETFYDESNGVLRSAKKIHQVVVPMEVLDEARSYTVYEREIVERKAYNSVTGIEKSWDFAFRPVTKDHLHIFHVADVHNRAVEAVLASRYAEQIDLLVMNGDVPEDSSRVEHFYTIYSIAEDITHGSIPIVFARGNHDLRGALSDQLTDYIPSDCGKSYYTFRVGSIWGIVLDCGEDKADTHPEYGYTVCCTPFRRHQTDFIRNVICHADDEYLAEGVETKLVISHNPFVHCDHPPFDIDKDIYSQWIALLREHVKPQLMLSGHTHTIEMHFPNDGWSTNGDLCPVLVGTAPRYQGHLVANLISINSGKVSIITRNDAGELIMENRFDI